MQYGKIIPDADEPEVAAENSRGTLFGGKRIYRLLPIHPYTRSCDFRELRVKYLFKPFPIVPFGTVKGAFERCKLFQQHGVPPR